MRLHHIVLAFLVGCFAFSALLSVSAQDYFDASTEVIMPYEEDAAYFDAATTFDFEEIAYFNEMAFGFGNEYAALFGIENIFASEPSGILATTTSSSASQCSKPSLLTATRVGTNSFGILVKLQWAKGVTGARPEGYRVYKGSTLLGTIYPGIINQTFYTDEVLASFGQMTDFYVSALDSSWRESEKAHVRHDGTQVTPTPPPSGPVPTLVSVTQVGGQAKVFLDWTYIPSATRYTIYRSTGGAWTQVWSGVGTFTGTGLAITNVQTTISCPTGTYLFAVTSSTGNTESNKSAYKLLTVK